MDVVVVVVVQEGTCPGRQAAAVCWQKGRSSKGKKRNKLSQKQKSGKNSQINNRERNR